MNKPFWKLLFICACSLVLVSVCFAAGSNYTKQLTANYVGIQLVVDGVSYEPKDANGNVVEPFIVDGTTYLPVRAVAEALGKEVNWDGETKTVYIGAKPTDRTAAGDTDTRPQRTGTSLNSVSIGLYQFQIPSFWIRDSSTDDYSAYAESGGKFAILRAYSRHADDVGFEQLDTEEERNEIIQIMLSSMLDTGKDSEVISTEVIRLADTTGVLWHFRGSLSDLPMTGYFLSLPSIENNHWVMVLCLLSDNTEYLYDDCIREIISSIKKTENRENTTPNIRSNIKDLLDSYERFVDEYVAFMQRYANADSEEMLSMVGDYYNLIIQLGEFEEKVNALDESDLTTAEWAYYLEVVNRVNLKLLSIVG